MADKAQNKKPSQKSFLQAQTMTIRGGLIGIALTMFLSWNTGKYNKIGIAIRRAKFVRHFITTKNITGLPTMVNYDQPKLDFVASNFFCYSGEPGIGKSHHFQNLVAKQSLNRPTLYLSFKTVGKDSNFQNDIAQQISFGEDGTGIIAEIIRAIKRIGMLNKKPERFWLKYVIQNLVFIAVQLAITLSNWEALYGMMALGSVLVSHAYFIYFFQPFLLQSLRKTVPFVVMDDLNKIQHMNMLSEVVRFLKLIQDNSSNIILVSSDEETWAHLRKQPGMKDRLRVRQIKYNHIETNKKFLEIIDNQFDLLMESVSGHRIYDKQIVKALAKQLIGVRQMSLRRFISVLKLYDEEQYQKLLQILKSRTDKPLSTVISEFTKLLFETQTLAMVSNLRAIKRQLKDMSDKQYIENLKLLLHKFKLPSDNKIASHLKLFNIVRDLRSQYVVNGRFVYIIYQMAVEEYQQDYKEYHQFKSLKEKSHSQTGTSSTSTNQPIIEIPKVTQGPKTQPKSIKEQTK